MCSCHVRYSLAYFFCVSEPGFVYIIASIANKCSPTLFLIMDLYCFSIVASITISRSSDIPTCIYSHKDRLKSFLHWYRHLNSSPTVILIGNL